MISHISTISKESYTINLDPACQFTPYEPNIDISDTISYKQVMKSYNLGPNVSVIINVYLIM